MNLIEKSIYSWKVNLMKFSVWCLRLYLLSIPFVSTCVVNGKLGSKIAEGKRSLVFSALAYLHLVVGQFQDQVLA